MAARSLLSIPGLDHPAHQYPRMTLLRDLPMTCCRPARSAPTRIAAMRLLADHRIDFPRQDSHDGEGSHVQRYSDALFQLLVSLRRLGEVCSRPWQLGELVGTRQHNEVRSMLSR
jgi:hypothetical protein